MDDIILKTKNLSCVFYAPLKMAYVRRSGLLSLIKSLLGRELLFLKIHFSMIEKFEFQLREKTANLPEFGSKLYMLTKSNRALIWHGVFADRREMTALKTQLSNMTDTHVEIMEGGEKKDGKKLA